MTAIRRDFVMVQYSPLRKGPRPNVESELRGLSMVYYVRHKGYVKIGYTSSIMGRLRTLHIKATDILAWEYGDLTLEAIRHDQFAHARVKGEGLGVEHYSMTPDLAEHIENLRSAMIARATRQPAKEDA